MPIKGHTSIHHPHPLPLSHKVGHTHTHTKKILRMKNTNLRNVQTISQTKSRFNAGKGGGTASHHTLLSAQIWGVKYKQIHITVELEYTK